MTFSSNSTTAVQKKQPMGIEVWLHHITQNRSIRKQQLLKQALILAQLVGEEQPTLTGESCLAQGLAIGDILNDLHLDEEAIAAGILYSCALYADLKAEDITEHVSSRVSKLIQDAKQMASISDLYQAIYSGEQQKHNTDNIRKMLLAMVDDIRVVLIKLAERLHILRCADSLSNQAQQQIAKETMAIYAPLANRLGITPVKLEMEDLAFNYLETKQYQKIAHYLKENRSEREQYIQEIIQEVSGLLKNANIVNFKITGRAKHIYSIYRKMQRKHVDVNEIYDVSAIRVLVDTVEDCYAVLGLVHSHWQPIAKEFDDYIATPKPNGYRSIHTAIKCPKGKNLEIQIRTYDMHQAAELGIAAHWVYKEGAPQKSKYEAKIAWLRQVMDWQKEIIADESDLNEIRQIFNDRIYVFTPAGDVVDLAQGATPLDFAYHVHSDLGHSCRGAKINGNIVPLTYQMKTGEHVEIIKGKVPTPRRDWLNPSLGFLKSSRAKAKVLHWFKEQDYENNVIHGRDLIEAEMRRLNCKGIDFNDLNNKLQFSTMNDMLAALGAGDIKIGTVINALQNIIKENEEKNLELNPPIQKSKIHRPSSRANDVQIQGVDNLLTNIAQCCRPVPGEPITGYITQGRGVSIHRATCHNILYATQNKPEKILNAVWGTDIANKYPVNITVTAYARTGLARDITNVIAKENLMLSGLNLINDKQENIVHFHLTIEIPGFAPLERIVAKIGKIQNVVEVRKLTN